MSSAATAQDGTDGQTRPPSSGAADLRAAKEELVRRHILDAAERVFAGHGFTQAKMQAIARQAGVSLATLYQSYPGKQELHRAVLLQRDREMMAQVMNHPAIASGQPLSVMPLLKMMRSHLLFLLTHTDYLRMILQEGHAWYEAAAQPTEAEKALWDQGLKLMSSVFAHGMEAGELIPAEPANQARLLMALQQARLASWVADRMQESHEQVITRVQADFVRQFCRPALAAELLTEDGSGLSERTANSLQN